MPVYLRKRFGLRFDVARRPRLDSARPMDGPRRDDPWKSMGTGWSVTSTLIGGIAVCGGIGYLVDRLIGTGHVFAAVGILIGAAAGTYLVYLKWGKGE
jgi:F0F1-type ATP synthase assembly protein I